MSPASIRLVFLQAEIISLLRDNMNTGKIVPGFPVETSDGVKVADVVWLTYEYARNIEHNGARIFSPPFKILAKDLHSLMMLKLICEHFLL